MSAWSAVLGLLLLEPRPLERMLTVAEGPCLDRASLAESTASWLGRPEVDDAIAVQVNTVSEERVAFRVWSRGVVTVERELVPTPSACEARTAAVGLLIALAIDERVSQTLGLAPPPVEALTPEAAEPALDDEDAPRLLARRAPPGPPARRAPVGVFLQASGSYEVVPGPGFGGRLGVSVRVRPRLDVDAGLLGIAGLQFPLGEGETQPTLSAGFASLCPVLASGRVDARLCLAPVLGVVVARGRGFGQDARAVLPWLGARTSADLRIPIVGRLSLTFEGGVIAPLVGTQFDVRNEGGILQERRAPAAAGFEGGLGVLVQIREAHTGG